MTSRPLPLRTDHIVNMSGVDGKGNQRRRDANLPVFPQIRPAHRVLSSYGSQRKCVENGIRSEKSHQRFAPSLGILPQSLKVLLKSKADALDVRTQSQGPEKAEKHRCLSAMIRAPLGQMRIITPSGNADIL